MSLIVLPSTEPGAFSNSSLVTCVITTSSIVMLGSPASAALATMSATVIVRYEWFGGDRLIVLVVSVITGGKSKYATGISWSELPSGLFTLPLNSDAGTSGKSELLRAIA